MVDPAAAPGPLDLSLLGQGDASRAVGREGSGETAQAVPDDAQRTGGWNAQESGSSSRNGQLADDAMGSAAKAASSALLAGDGVARSVSEGPAAGGVQDDTAAAEGVAASLGVAGLALGAAGAAFAAYSARRTKLEGEQSSQSTGA